MNFNEASLMVAKAFEDIDWRLEPKGLYEPIHHILSNGGKRLRPSLLLMATSIFKDDVKDALQPSIGIEVFHNSTLLHDDLMDNAVIRRGQPTVHTKWNDNTAILSGDAMMLLSFQRISDVPTTYIHDVLEVFNTISLQVCDGQEYDMEFETCSDVRVEEYIKMITYKTAVLLAGSLKMGAIIGGASKNDQQKIYDFGINLGLAFQLVDDLLDVYGDEATFGKAIGGDITENKKTFMLISAINTARGETEKDLQNWLNKSDFDRNEKVRAITAIYNKLGIRDLAEKKAEQYFEKSLEALHSLSVQNETTKALADIAEKLLNRNN